MLGLEGRGPYDGQDGQLSNVPEQKPKRNAKRFYHNRIMTPFTSWLFTPPHLHLSQTETKDTLIEDWQLVREKREMERN